MNNESSTDKQHSKGETNEGGISSQITEIPFTRESGGLCRVKCDINGLPLSF